MDETDKLKEIRSALNARLFLLILGVLLILNGVTSTGRQGLAYRNLAAAIDERIVSKEALPDEKEPGSDDDRKDNAAAEGTAAAAEQSVEEQLDSFILQMDEVGMTTGDLRRISVFFLVAAVFEIAVGLICAIFSNRVDRAKITFTAVCILLAVELVFLIYMTMNNGLMLSMLINCLLIPIVLLWSSWRMLKLSKADPSRKYATESRRTAGPRPEAPSPAPPAPPRSIKDRAMWQTEAEPSADMQAEDEAGSGAETAAGTPGTAALVESESETRAETETQTKAGTEDDTETVAEAETRGETETGAEIKTGTDAKADAGTEA